jgi:hypothetical protein
MRLLACSERGSLRKTPCKDVHGCCLDSLQEATALIDELAAFDGRLALQRMGVRGERMAVNGSEWQ